MKNILKILKEWLSKPLNLINKILASGLIFLIRIYQIILSPDKGIPSIRLKGKICVHKPHCSEYSIQVLKRYGFIPGFIYMTDRITSCHPWNQNHYDPSFLKVVFFSSAAIGVPFLTNLQNDNRFEISGVVTMPDAPSGRGMKLNENIVKTKAKELGIDENIIKTPNKINPDKSQTGKEFHAWLESIKPDIFIVIAYGKIIPKSILDIPTKGPINVHGSILPKYRGASPIQTVFLNDDKETGITIMLMNEKMDEGDILKILKLPIGFDTNTKTIIDKMIEHGPKFLNDTVIDYSKGHITPQVQDSNQTTYCKKIEKEDGKIDLYKENLHSIYNKYRAYFLWPKIRFEMDERFGNHQGKRVIIEEIIFDKNKFNESKSLPILVGKMLNDSIISMKLKPEGKSSISWEEFTKGYKII